MRCPTASEARLGLAVASIAVATPLVARLRPETMHRVLEARLWRRRDLPCSDERLLQIIDKVLWRAPTHTGNWCLVRGITAYRMLRGVNRDVHLVFGARLVEQSLEAHCWLSDGVDTMYERADTGAPFEEMFRLTPVGVVLP